MFTDNYLKYREMYFMGQSTSKVIISDGTSLTIGTNNTQASDFGANMHNAYCGKPTGSSGGIYFGKGTTPPTKADYKLEYPIESGLSITNNSKAVITNPREGVYECSAYFVVTNTGTEEITISEMGYFANVGGALSLFERSVLPVPLVIPVGESKLITYKLTFNQILNVG